jgi:hypothetical protein
LRLPLGLLLVLLGMTAAAGPGAGDVGAGLSPVVGTHASAATVTHDDPYRALLLAALGRQAPTTTLPDDGRALCPHATGGYTAQGWSLLGGADSTDMVGTAPRACLGRAPPTVSAGQAGS